jgi:hypothetical protein
MKMPDDGPKCEPQHVAVIKTNANNLISLFLLLC